MIIKYKLGDLAKDMSLPNKDVIAVLEPLEGQARKHTTVLSEDELDFFFNAITLQRQAKDLNAYFANDVLPEDKPKEKKPAAKKESPSKENAQKKTDAKPAQKTQQPQKQQAQPAQKQKQQPQRPAEKRDIERSAQKQLRRAEARENQGQGKSNVVQERVSRVVDTRASEVDLSKYNEKYDVLATQNGAENNRRRNQGNIQGNKQKFSNRQNKNRQQYQKRETEAQRLQRLQLEKARHAQLKIMIPDEISVGELASRLKAQATVVIKKLMSLGVMASVSELIDFDTAALVAEELGAKVEREVHVTIEERLNIAGADSEEDPPESLVSRAPVVVVMGHVDHGKTSILDYIRKSHVQSGEAGGITQHIGAYQVKQGGKSITFLDTPGHEAFTAIRARGASVTDIAVLVIAADDGIMPQTVEAINHAKAANVPIIVALNKIDKPEADPERVKASLTEYDLVPEEWGGDVVCVNVSAKTGEGIDELLEMINLVADVQNLKANPDRLALGTVIESRLDKGRGPIATILVQKGTLRSGDVVIAGTAIGRVRQMTDENGNTVESAGPSVPVEITGLVEVPQAGDRFNAVKDEKLARELVEERRTAQQEEKFKNFSKVTLDTLFSHIEEGEVKELPIIVKADVQGSCEALRQSLEKLSNDEVRVRIIHMGVGGVSANDIMLADASGAIVIGFNVRPDAAASSEAEEKGIEMRMYRIIYDAIDDVEKALKGMLAPKIREVDLGSAEVRQVYKISSVGTIAGCYVTKGTITRNSIIRVVRDGIIIYDDEISSLRRFKDDVREVAQGYECGISLGKFNDIKEGDVLEAYRKEEYREE
ncbi:MAG: translation initiation factor IF-2 [Oscillospiraceae bacterium]|nr:translation initiation factor IF-2 [Oscillospiraceae bacterium]MBR5071126.1 translation initiation factor IF-2 [Oscillospiraceae bacterium]